MSGLFKNSESKLQVVVVVVVVVGYQKNLISVSGRCVEKEAGKFKSIIFCIVVHQYNIHIFLMDV